MMKTTKFNFLFLALVLIFSTSLSAQVTVLNSLDEPEGITRPVGRLPFPTADNLILAQEFVTGSSAYTNEPITVTINLFSTGGSSTFLVEIYNKSGANPGTSIATLSGANMPALGDATYTGMVTLAASTSYFIVISAVGSSPRYEIYLTSSDNITAALGFTAPNEHQTSGTTAPNWGVDNVLKRIRFSIQMGAALPVELLGFKGESKEKVNVLEWATVRETNNDYFEIQHSLDGENFDALGTENGRGTSNTLSNYRFFHENPSLGTHYYRLKQMDFDARFEYSEIISLKVQEGEDRFTLYPNPAKDQLTIVNGQGTGFISNFLGQAVQHFNVEENQKTIRIDNLKQGHYFLQIFQANGEKVSKIFVKK
jgi:hypothetical protein